MKLKAVEKLCKKRGVVYLFDEPAVVEYVEDEEIKSPPRQWMGDGAALYPLDGVPYLDEGGVYAIFDVNDKQRDKLRVSHQEYMPGDVCFDDVCPGEVTLEIVNLKLSLGGTELILLKDAAGHLMTIDAEYKKPFDNWKDCQLCRRVTPGGATYVAVMGGYLLRGLIWPYMAVDERFVEVLGEIYNAAAVSLEAKRAEGEQLEAIRAEEAEKLRQEFEEERAKTLKECREEIAAMEKERDKAIEKAEREAEDSGELAAKLEKVKADHKTAMDKLKADHDKKLAELEASYKKQVKASAAGADPSVVRVQIALEGFRREVRAVTSVLLAMQQEGEAQKADKLKAQVEATIGKILAEAGWTV